MAAKAKAKPAGVALAVIPNEVTKSLLVALEDVSVARDSGWRDEDRERVEELKHEFLIGQYGMNVLKKPSLLQWAGQPKVCLDGRRKLGDGKQTFIALMECKQLWQNEDEAGKYDWTPRLVDTFVNGVDVSVIEFSDDDEDLVLAWATSCHDVESNKYRATSMQDLVKVAKRYHNKTPGGSWPETQKKLEGMYGKGRRMFVYRMVTAALTLPDTVLEALAASKFPNSWVHENKYFVGQGQDLSKRLSTEFRVKVIEIASADIGQLKGLSQKVFETDYCRPYKEAEKWIKSSRKQFGVVADIPAFERVASFLMSSKARIPILACLSSGVKLDGASDQMPGIEACRTIIKELTAAQSAAAEAYMQSQRPSQGTAVVSDPLAGGPPSGDNLDAESKIEVDGDGMESCDPLLETAATKADVEMSKHQVYNPTGDWVNQICSQVMPSQKAVILVDAPTSKSRVVMDHLDKVGDMAKVLTARRYRIVVPVGKRLDLLSSVENKMQVLFPALHHFTIQLVHGKNRQTKKQTAAILTLGVDHRLLGPE